MVEKRRLSLTTTKTAPVMGADSDEVPVRLDEIKDAVKFILLVAFIFTTVGIIVELFVVR